MTLPVINVDTFSLSRSSAYKELYFPRKILKPEVDVNTYYYCRRCCCRWWHLLLGLLVLRPSISSLLQSATAFFITKCDGLLLQSATAFLLQSATSVITKCDRYYKVWQFYYKVRQVLQSATIITKCDSTHGPPENFEIKGLWNNIFSFLRALISSNF